MTASPPTELSEHYAENASCSAAPGMPSEETIERALNLAARAMHRQFGANDTEEAIEAAIWQHLRPAFEAKNAEIEIEREVCKQRGIMIREEAARADALQAKLAQAVEALEPFVQAFDAAREKYVRRYGADSEVGMKNFDKMPDFWPMEKLAFNMGDFRRARSASAAARGA